MSGDWRQAGFDAANTKFNKAESTLTTANVHEVVADWNIADATASSPAVVGSHIYVQGTTAVTSRNIATGAVEWSFPIASGLFEATVAVQDGVVYAMGKIANPATVYAIDAATGTQRWKLNVAGFAGRDIMVTDGLLFVGDFDGALIAVDTATHKVKWTFTSGGTVDRAAVAGGHVYVSSLDHNVYSLDETTGEVEWNYDTGEEILNGPSVARGIVYVGVRHGITFAINASDGSFRWKYETGAKFAAGVAIAKGAVYFGAHDGYLYSLNAKTGAFRWKFKTAKPIIIDAAVANGVVYISSYDKFMYALDAKTGAKLWSLLAGSSPLDGIVVSNGALYGGFPTGRLRRFVLPD